MNVKKNILLNQRDSGRKGKLLSFLLVVFFAFSSLCYAETRSSPLIQRKVLMRQPVKQVLVNSVQKQKSPLTRTKPLQQHPFSSVRRTPPSVRQVAKKQPARSQTVLRRGQPQRARSFVSARKTQPLQTLVRKGNLSTSVLRQTQPKQTQMLRSERRPPLVTQQGTRRLLTVPKTQSSALPLLQRKQLVVRVIRTFQPKPPLKTIAAKPPPPHRLFFSSPLA